MLVRFAQTAREEHIGQGSQVENRIVAAQVAVPQRLHGLPDGIDFGMQAGILSSDGGIVRLAKDLMPEQDHCTIAFIAFQPGGPCLLDGEPHHAFEINPDDPLQAMIGIRPNFFVAAQETQLRIELGKKCLG